MTHTAVPCGKSSSLARFRQSWHAKLQWLIWIIHYTLLWPVSVPWSLCGAQMWCHIATHLQTHTTLVTLGPKVVFFLFLYHIFLSFSNHSSVFFAVSQSFYHFPVIFLFVFHSFLFVLSEIRGNTWKLYDTNLSPKLVWIIFQSHLLKTDYVSCFVLQKENKVSVKQWMMEIFVFLWQ